MIQPYPSLEIVPPLNGVTKDEPLGSVRPFLEFNPRMINVTCHRDEYEFRQEPDGSFSRHIVRRRVSETAVCAAIKAELGVNVVPHIICGGVTADQIESQLHDMKFMGIHSVFALRGDSLIGEKRFTPTPGGYRYASELVSAIKAFAAREGHEFEIGVGAYPEKHFEAPNLEMDIANLKHKVDCGADYIVTQMFFDNAVFYEFRDKCRAAGITVPIIPGLKPLSTIRHIELLPESFSIDIPQDLASEVIRHKDDRKACYRIGLEWCSEQCRDLLKHDVPSVHFYTMGRPDNIVEILKANF